MMQGFLLSWLARLQQLSINGALELLMICCSGKVGPMLAHLVKANALLQAMDLLSANRK